VGSSTERRKQRVWGGQQLDDCRVGQRRAMRSKVVARYGTGGGGEGGGEI